MQIFYLFVIFNRSENTGKSSVNDGNALTYSTGNIRMLCSYNFPLRVMFILSKFLTKAKYHHIGNHPHADLVYEPLNKILILDTLFYFIVEPLNKTYEKSG